MDNSAVTSLPAINNGFSTLSPVRFLLICVLAFVLANWLPDSIFAPLNRATASTAGECLARFDKSAVVSGDMISLNNFRVHIITECTVLNSAVLLGAFIFSAPAFMISKVTGFGIGTALLFIVNTARIALITVIGANYPALFEAVHVYLAQVIMIVVVIAFSSAWLRRATTNTISVIEMFLVRAAALATVIFPCWLLINRSYVEMLDILVSKIFAFAGTRLIFTYEHSIYFQTCNTVLFLSLILADRKLPAGSKIVWAVAGSALLAVGHLFFRIGNVLLTAYSWHSVFQFTTFLILIGEYVLPILLVWAASAHCRFASNRVDET